jgi:hypothetical protein
MMLSMFYPQLGHLLPKSSKRLDFQAFEDISLRDNGLRAVNYQMFSFLTCIP